MVEQAIEEMLASLGRERPLSRRSFIGLAGAGIALVACGGSTGSPTGQAKSPLPLGVIQPLTGSLTASFAPLFIPLQIAVDEINAAGGILGRKIENHPVDDQGAPANEVSVGQQLADQDLTFVAGPVGSSQSLASVQATQRHKIIQCPQAEDLTVGDPKTNPGAFILVRSADQSHNALFNYVAGLGSKKVAVMYENTAFGQATGPVVVNSLTSKNVKPVAVEVFEQQAASLVANVQRVKSSGAEVIALYSSSAGPAIKVVTALMQTDYSPILVGESSFLPGIVSLMPAGTKVPNSLLQNIRMVTFKSLTWAPGQPVPAKQLKYLQKVSSAPNVGSGKYAVAQSPYYDFLYILKRSIESANSFDYAKVKKEMENGKPLDGILGKISFTPTRHFGISDDSIGIGAATDLTASESLGFLPMRIS